jgi:hypothetical protein
MEKKTIYEALALIANEIPAISKDKYNDKQDFKFRGIEDVYNAIQPLFAKYGVVTIPQVLSVKREERQSQKGNTLIWTLAEVKYIFASSDGSSVELIITGEAMDTGDKGLNKAYSIAHKYALFQLFLIPTAIEDPDRESHEVSPAKPLLSDKTFKASMSKLQESGKVEDAKKWLSRFELTDEQKEQFDLVVAEITNAVA